MGCLCEESDISKGKCGFIKSRRGGDDRSFIRSRVSYWECKTGAGRAECIFGAE